MLHWWKDSYLQAWKNIQSERGAGEKHLQGRLVRPVATAVLARTIILTCDVGMAPWRFAATTLSVFTFSRWLWWGRCVRCETATVWDSFFLLAEVRLFKIKPLSLSFFASFLKCPTESGSEGSDKNLSNRERIRKKKKSGACTRTERIVDKGRTTWQVPLSRYYTETWDLTRAALIPFSTWTLEFWLTVVLLPIPVD